MLCHTRARTNERAFFRSRFFFSSRVSRQESDPSREALDIARAATSIPALSIDWRFSSGRFWRSTFRRPFTLYISLPPSTRRLRHGPRTNVTDSTSVKKANTKPISAPSTTSVPCMRDHCPFPTLIRAVDSSNKRPPSLYSLGLCRAHAVLLLCSPYDLVPYINQAFQFIHVKIDSSSRNMKPHDTYRRGEGWLDDSHLLFLRK